MPLIPLSRASVAVPAVLAVVTATLLAGPASAVVLDGDGGSATVRAATEVAPQPVALRPAVRPARGRTAARATVAPPRLDPARAAALGKRVTDALSASGASAIAAVVEVDGYGPVLRRDPHRPLPPASTQKNVTGLSALLATGPSRRLRTEVAVNTRPSGGALRGHLWLVAGGDPYLTDAGLRELAHRVRATGITSVVGDLRLDDSRYDQQRRGAGWKASYVPGQSGPLSALALDRNRWRSDRAFLADPAMPATLRFRAHLQAQGVRVLGAVRRDRRPAGARTLVVRHSPPMSALVARALKSSDNFASELLLKEVGREVRGQGTTAAGVAASKQLLGARGVVLGAAGDGSGLSTIDRQTPAGLVRLLRAAQESPAYASFRASLPVGCRDGTLRRRFCGTPAQGRVWAKTGTLSGVRALSGWTRTASGRDVRFAIQLAGVRDSAQALKAIDRAVVLLAGAPE